MLAKAGIPIIFVQAGRFFNGNSRDLMGLALRQAVAASPDSDVILLTDKQRPALPEITQALLSDYRTWDAIKFRWRYRHTSDSPADFERFCFVRWYYIREFVRREGIDRFCLFDTDILLFSPVETFAAEFAGYRAGNWTWANVISDVSILDEMIAYFERIFADARLLKEISTKYYPGAPPRVTDMVALFEMAKGNPAFLDQNTLPPKGFDSNINYSWGDMFAMDGPVRLLRIGADGVPRGKRSSDGTEVPFHFLHFQGPAKPLMEKFAWSSARSDRRLSGASGVNGHEQAGAAPVRTDRAVA